MSNKLSPKTFIFSQIFLLIAGLAFLASLYFYLNKDFSKPSIANYIPVTQKPASFSLEVNNPEDQLLTYNKTIVISGKTSPKATVIISTNASDAGLEADSKGEFSTVVDLKPNINDLKISAFDEFGNTQSNTRTVFYTEEKIQ